MSRRNQVGVLVILLAVLAVTIGYHFWPSDDSAKVAPTSALFTPINVDNPALRMDVLHRFLSLEYKGTHRNIFIATLPPPPQTVQKAAPVSTAPPVPAGPPPLTVDAKYFGFVSDSAGSHRRAFFATANNEDVFIAGEGDTLMGRFRVVRLTNTTADVEEVSSGRHATLTLEEPGPNG
jgi:hypothetical protein